MVDEKQIIRLFNNDEGDIVESDPIQYKIWISDRALALCNGIHVLRGTLLQIRNGAELTLDDLDTVKRIRIWTDELAIHLKVIQSYVQSKFDE